MPKYIVQNIQILYGNKGDKEATAYNPGDTMDLSEKEAQSLIAKGYLVIPPPEKKDK